MIGSAKWLVIFDCDGTLVDSEYLCNLALENCLFDIGVFESATSLLSRYRGAKLANILADVGLRHGQEIAPEFVDGYRAAVATLFEKELRPTADVSEALSQIPHQKCVASSGPVAKIRQAIELTHLAEFFGDRIYSSYVVQSWKPAPCLFLHAAAAEGILPAKCIVVEDSLLGIEAAKRAGMGFLLFDPDDHHLDAELPPGTRFSSMKMLPELISSLTSSEISACI